LDSTDIMNPNGPSNLLYSGFISTISTAYLQELVVYGVMV